MQYHARAHLPKYRRPFILALEQLEDRLVPGETLTGLLLLPAAISPLAGDTAPQIDGADSLASFSVAGPAGSANQTDNPSASTERASLLGEASVPVSVPAKENGADPGGAAAAVAPVQEPGNDNLFGSGGQAVDFANPLGAFTLPSAGSAGGGHSTPAAVGGGQTGQNAAAALAPSGSAGSTGASGGGAAGSLAIPGSNGEPQPAGLNVAFGGGSGEATAEPMLHATSFKRPHGGGGGTPAGYSPAQIRHAYGFDQVAKDGSGITIGIVDAYDDPTIQSDLNTFSTKFGLPTTGSGAFTFTKAYAQGSKPTTNGGWAQEISLDVEWAHAIAPHANILLVESASNSFTDLFGGVDYAVGHGAQAVSMSWGAGDFAGESTYDSHFNQAGVTFLASSGDTGGQVIYPAASPFVVSVGGTTLPLDSSGNRTSAETAWSSGGGGPSLSELEPAYQVSFGIVASGRATPDVSYDANPNTGVAVYDSTSYFGQSGWLVFGGTSAGSPQWAGLVALADQGRATPLSSNSLTSAPVYNAAAAAYSSNYTDIVSGSNGYPAGPGYDLATGLGSPLANNLVPYLNTH